MKLIIAFVFVLLINVLFSQLSHKGDSLNDHLKSTAFVLQKSLINDTALTIDERVESLLSMMTLDEKIGQMNQYNGFWDVTGPVPNEGNAKEKYNDLANGLIGSMLNVRGAKEVRAVQNVAVNDTRLGIPLILSLIHI